MSAAYLTFVAASLALILLPGPNVAVIVSHALTHGVRAGLLTVAGTTIAIVIQMSLVVLGLSTLISAFADAFAWLRWMGVGYLLYLGVKMWRDAGKAFVAAEGRDAHLFWRGFLVSLANPKTLLFYGAFLTPFVSPEAPALPQLALLGGTFVTLAAVCDSLWAVLAGRLRVLAARSHALQQRLTGSLLIGAAIGLALARKNPA